VSTVLTGTGVCACGCGGTTKTIDARGYRRSDAGKHRLFIKGHNQRGQQRPDKRKPIVDAFWAKVDRTTTPDGCWLWTGTHGKNGYGLIKSGGRRRTVHRLSLELALGRPLGPGMEACHSCDTKLCVRTGPGHLYEGTHADNMQDLVRARASEVMRCA
jgi:hypothetical protein